MKKNLFAVGLIILASSVMILPALMAETGRNESKQQPGTIGSSAYDKATNDYNAMMGEAKRQQAQYEQQMEESNKLIDEQKALIMKSKEQNMRFDKILATWEKQQVQYQRYLDSLEKK